MGTLKKGKKKLVVIGSAKPKLTNEKNLNKFFLCILANGIEIGTCVHIYIYIYIEMNTYVVD
jgi:hypothetical protein